MLLPPYAVNQTTSISRDRTGWTYFQTHLILVKRSPRLGKFVTIKRMEATELLCAHVLACRDISWSLVQSPALWAFALAQDRDALAFLQAFWAMRRGFTNGTFRYAVMLFQKTGGLA